MKKNDIYRMFAGEILAITTMASLPGFLLMAYILDKVSQISYFSKMFLIDPTVLGISLVLIYGFNLVFGAASLSSGPSARRGCHPEQNRYKLICSII